MTRRIALVNFGLLTAAGLLLACDIALAEEAETIYPRAYDGFQASRDAQIYWDARRRDDFNRQLGWNQFYRSRAAATLSGTLLYDPYLPYVPTDFWGPTYWEPTSGYGYYNPVPQPIGRREVQTGPNRWESFPIYAEDVVKPNVPLSESPSTKRPYIAPPAVVAPPKAVAPTTTPTPIRREF